MREEVLPDVVRVKGGPGATVGVFFFFSFFFLGLLGFVSDPLSCPRARPRLFSPTTRIIKLRPSGLATPVRWQAAG